MERQLMMRIPTQAVHCVLRWLRGRDSKNHAIVAGLLAGCCIRLYPNTPAVLYLAWKTVETLYSQGMDAGRLPHVAGFSILLYSLSTAVLFHASVLEPHNLKPAYWRFLNRITHQRIAEMNRVLLDGFGLQSSKLNPQFWPNYNMNMVSHHLKSWLTYRP